MARLVPKTTQNRTRKASMATHEFPVYSTHVDENGRVLQFIMSMLSAEIVHLRIAVPHVRDCQVSLH